MRAIIKQRASPKCIHKQTLVLEQFENVLTRNSVRALYVRRQLTRQVLTTSSN